jgi:hypothetical protein
MIMSALKSDFDVDVRLSDCRHHGVTPTTPGRRDP